MKHFLIADDRVLTRYALKAILVAEYINAHPEQAGDAAVLLAKVMDEQLDEGIDTAMTEFINTLNRLLPAKKYFPPPIEKLSDREFEIARLLASGMSLSKVAEKLSLDFTGTRTYRSRIMEKLQLKTNIGLTLYAIKHKMI